MDYSKLNPADLTPAMRQFVEIKQKHPDCLLLFRMGDFYETFYADAKTIARDLEITLTSRGKGVAKAPLAGLPYHALDNYLPKLIKKGHKVAICEQIEDPKTVKGRIVKRDVVRIITPGTVTQDAVLDSKTNNYLMSIVKKQNYGISLVDVTTGEFLTSELTEDEIINEITRFNPAEIILPESIILDKKFIEKLKSLELYLNYYSDYHFNTDSSTNALLKHFKVHNLDGFGLKPLSIRSSGALISYLKETQMIELNHINKLKYFSTQKYMILDRSTQRNLELISNIRDNSKRGTLLSVLDHTTTSMGGRLLKKWILQPLLDKKEIEQRYDIIEEIKNDPFLIHELKDLLKNINDLERLVSKISYDSVNARDLLSLRNSLEVLPEIKNQLQKTKHLQKFAQLPTLTNIFELIKNSITEAPPILIKDGNIIKYGYNEELDELKKISQDTKTILAELEQKEKEKLGISTLRIGYNRVFGYYVEVTRANKHLVPDTYIRKQTTKNSERYITEELKILEAKILGAEEKSIALEYQLFKLIVKEIKNYISDLQLIASLIAELDCLLSLTSTAIENDYVRPQINDKNKLFLLNSRHPVVEIIEETFIPNDVLLDPNNKIMIITGPNMAGKSTFMRQVALLQLMAQIGSFVPADEASICLVDRIFTRVGAYDDLTMGQSTFMVEMTETANILNNATESSLIILDEIGRGTSTFDGISLAWSIAEYIHDAIGAKTLFATHYHQMNKLESKLKNITNYNISVKELDDDIIFLRKIVKGGTNKSYGVQVAKLAGLPEDVIERSKVIMNRLEMDDEISDRIHSDLKVKKVFEKKINDDKPDPENQMTLNF